MTATFRYLGSAQSFVPKPSGEAICFIRSGESEGKPSRATRRMRRWNGQDYWLEPPQFPSPKLLYWLERIKTGFRPNRRLSQFGYYERAEWYGVYIWEQLNVLDKAIHEARKEDARKARDPAIEPQGQPS